ncbi:MAG: sporulation protein YabP [Bacilli bacterium]
MNYENASVLSNQNIVLKDRKKLEISGIKKIESLNSEEFLIDTKLGLLFIKGQDLEMQMLDIDKGNIWISGLITVIEYVETSEKKRKLVFSKKFLNNDNIYTKRRIIFNCLFI